ncbi:MAG: hypothetical protein U5N86_04130 [Planctomycetota bacterium]|nr:hypothetical protein [Planctomycetota bacterium]
MRNRNAREILPLLEDFLDDSLRPRGSETAKSLVSSILAAIADEYLAQLAHEKYLAVQGGGMSPEAMNYYLDLIAAAVKRTSSQSARKMLLDAASNCPVEKVREHATQLLRSVR